jgi:ADP-ribose pyrophosphatase YjhB (NUDIX family)
MPHIHEKIDFCADTFVVNGDAVLLRMHDKHHIWLPPGGHIELDEEPQQAATREVKEEVGMEVELVGKPQQVFKNGEKELLVPRVMNRHYVNETHEHICFIFFARSNTREFTQGETEVSDDIRWFTKEELDDLQYGVSDRIRHYAHAALEELAS